VRLAQQLPMNGYGECADCMAVVYAGQGNICERCFWFCQAWAAVRLLCEQRGELSTAGLVV
jgi:hypothetical protein